MMTIGGLMKKILKIIKTILLVGYIPIFAYGIYIFNFKVYSESDSMFSGLEPVSDGFLFLFACAIDFLLILVNQLIYHIVIYVENKNDNNSLVRKVSKERIILILSILLCILSAALYYPVKCYVEGYTFVSVEPAYDEVAYLAENENYVTVSLINENGYSVTVLKKLGEDPNTGIFSYLAKIEESNKLIEVHVKKYYKEKNITKSRSEIELVLMDIYDY